MKWLSDLARWFGLRPRPVTAENTAIAVFENPAVDCADNIRAIKTPADVSGTNRSRNPDPRADQRRLDAARSRARRIGGPRHG